MCMKTGFLSKDCLTEAGARKLRVQACEAAALLEWGAADSGMRGDKDSVGFAAEDCAMSVSW